MRPLLFSIEEEEMTKESFLARALVELERIFQNWPQPLFDPVWYPGQPEKVLACLDQWGARLKEMIEIVVLALKQEGFFDENPLIRVYPRYPEASGIVVFYKGQQVFEKWINTFEMNWGDRKEVAQEMSGWYDQMHHGMSPEEYEYFDRPWERDWR